MPKTLGPTPAADLARREAVIYARVSSKEQEKEGFSIPAQLKLLRGYAEMQHLTVKMEYVDVETAKQIGRAAFSEMVGYLKEHPAVRVMLVEKTDRLYRNLKDWVTVDELDVKRTFSKVFATSALPQKADMAERDWGCPLLTQSGHSQRRCY
jgi:site-specific DNA recombinase